MLWVVGNLGGESWRSKRILRSASADPWRDSRADGAFESALLQAKSGVPGKTALAACHSTAWSWGQSARKWGAESEEGSKVGRIYNHQKKPRFEDSLTLGLCQLMLPNRVPGCQVSLMRGPPDMYPNETWHRSGVPWLSCRLLASAPCKGSSVTTSLASFKRSPSRPLCGAGQDSRWCSGSTSSSSSWPWP